MSTVHYAPPHRVAAWRAAAATAVGLGVVYHHEADAVVASCYHWLKGTSVFAHDSFEPALSVFFLIVWLTFFYLIDAVVPWTKRPAEENGTWKAGDRLWGWKPIAFYLLPLVVYDMYRPRRTLPEDAPSALLLVSEVVGCLVVYDFVFFFAHLALHRVPGLYKWHHEHHEHLPVRASETMRMSMTELSIDVGISILAVNVTKAHPLSRALYDIVITYMLCELHCDRDMSWMAHNVVPFGIVGGPPVHAAHHKYGKVHFQKFFTYLDRLCGYVQKQGVAARLSVSTTAPRQKREEAGSPALTPAAAITSVATNALDKSKRE